jgi:tetratricopeptide (TPR) repeat protein
MTSWKPIDDAPHQPTALSSPATKISLAHRPWLLALVLVLVTFAAYTPVWHAGFIWDDDDHLTANHAVAASNGLKMIWSSLHTSRYYPLTLTTFWFERRLWGLDPRPYHLVNIALHAANGVLIFLLLRRWRIPGAWLAAMLWLLHPVNVESVAWITELKNTQSGLFFFLSILGFLRFDAGKNHRWYVLALACGLAAMLSKPSTVVLPVVLLLCVWWERGILQRADIMRVIPFFTMALGMSALTVAEQRGMVLGAGTTEWQLGPAERLGIAGKAVWFYAAKAVWPVRLTFVYPRWDMDASSPLFWAPLAAVVAVGVILWKRRSLPGCRAALFGWAFFLVALGPVLGFFDVFYFRYSYVADHFQYLACLGLISLAASTGTAICKRAGRRGRDLGTVAAAIALLVLGASTWRQARIYQDLKTLWGDTLMKNPQCWLAHNNLGLVLESLGRVQEAIGHYEQALRIRPDYAEAHYNLGNTQAQVGRVPEAIGHYQQALRIKPDFSEAHCNLGNVLLQEGKVSDAIGHYEQAVRIKPDNAEAHSNLGNALAQVGRVPEAIAHHEQALRIRPDYAEAHYNLGITLYQTGKREEAIEHFQQALRLKPDYVEAHSNLGIALAQTGKIEEAIAHYEQALRIRPDYAEAHNNLGIALAQTGKIEEAIAHYEQALRVKPDYVIAQDNLAWLLATLAPAEGGNPVRAVSLAEQACRLTSDRVAPYLYTLAAAYAAAGRFNDAIATAVKAIDLARSAGQTEVVKEIEARLQLYRSGRAYNQSTGRTSPSNP